MSTEPAKSTGAMRERPILFSAPMVRALLAGSKTQTRRIVKPQWSTDVSEVSERPAHDPVLKCVVSGHSGEWEDEHSLDEVRCCPYGIPGDQLWVKETFCVGYSGSSDDMEATHYHYRASEALPGVKWTPSIFCTRAASRIQLEITGVRVERLNDISREDAIAEGISRFQVGGGETVYRLDHWSEGMGTTDQIEVYRRLWDDINGIGSFNANPWVWVIEFRRIAP